MWLSKWLHRRWRKEWIKELKKEWQYFSQEEIKNENSGVLKKRVFDLSNVQQIHIYGSDVDVTMYDGFTISSREGGYNDNLINVALEVLERIAEVEGIKSEEYQIAIELKGEKE